MKNLKFYVIFLSLFTLFLLFDWYHSRTLNLDYIKIVIVSLTVVFAFYRSFNIFHIFSLNHRCFS